jgi:hypothetical protein
MSLKILLLAIAYNAVLAAAVPIKIHHWSFVDAAPLKQQTQETMISLESEQLRHPHFLSVSSLAKGTQLTGQIKLNGKYIKKLDNNIKINLAPFLKRGKHTIAISGSYRPVRDSVEVSFSGPNTQVSQQSGGNGYFNQILIIEVR